MLLALAWVVVRFLQERRGRCSLAFSAEDFVRGRREYVRVGFDPASMLDKPQTRPTGAKIQVIDYSNPDVQEF